jgi:pimeloyl-ACP methyl ester carboxylesterase
MADGIVLVHGGMHSSHCWQDLLPLLKQPVVAVDLPGRGPRADADRSKVGLADCVAAVIEDADKAGFDRFTLVGHSLGGVTITETGFQHPDRVAALVYVGALVPPPGSNASRVMTGDDLPGPMEPMDDAIAKSMFGNDMTDEQWTEHAKGIVPDAVGIMNGVLSGYPSGMPIVYVNMSQDIPVPPALADQMAANLGPTVERRTIDAGHSVMVTKPHELAEIVNEVAARA